MVTRMANRAAFCPRKFGLFSPTKLELGGRRLKCILETNQECIGAVKAKNRVDKKANKYKLARSKFKQGMRLLTIRRMECLSSFQTEAKGVVRLETQLLGTQYVHESKYLQHQEKFHVSCGDQRPILYILKLSKQEKKNIAD